MTMRAPSFTPFKQSSPFTKTAKGAAEFLRSHDKMAALLPSITRMAALQKDCAAALPAMFTHCAVLQFEADQLVLSVPNAALAARLKQQCPKLQEQLLQRGWQVNAIRLKVQVSKMLVKSTASNQLVLPSQAVSAFEELSEALENSPRNQALKNALGSLMQHRRIAK
ncbi:DciA family protein [Herminiimonas aquatilis]|uniref:DciA family protein n=1 Tax=Herminiimonas aquatilis TaxID=345342 RepID=A0ABW2J6V1_9BURK